MPHSLTSIPARFLLVLAILINHYTLSRATLHQETNFHLSKVITWTL